MSKRAEMKSYVRALRIEDPYARLIRRVYAGLFLGLTAFGLILWRARIQDAPPGENAPLYATEATVLQKMGGGRTPRQILFFRIHGDVVEMNVDPFDRQYAQVQIGDVATVAYQIGPGGQILVRSYKLRR